MASKTLASLIVRIGADVTGVTAGLNTLDKRVRSTKKQFSTVTDSTLKWQSALGVLAGAAGIGYAAKKIFDLGSGLEETASKFRTVFGASTQDAQKFLDEFANTAGLTITAGRELLATTGAIAQGMGFSGAASEKFAEQITRLSGDLSSFNNIPIAETSRAIQSALTGERESLKRLGIVILETDVQKKALAMTGKENAKALTQQEKATATLALITERAGVAVGDLARTMDSPANKARRIVAGFADLRDSIAHGLLPAFAVLLEELDGGAANFNGIRDAIDSSGAQIEQWAKFVIEAMKFAAKAFAAPIQIAFNLGQVIGDLARITYYYLTKNFAMAGIATAQAASEFVDMWKVTTGLVAAFDSMSVASYEAWKAQKTIADGADAAAAALNREAAAVVALTEAQQRMLAIGPGFRPMPGIFDIAPEVMARRKIAQDNLRSGAVTYDPALTARHGVTPGFTGAEGAGAGGGRLNLGGIGAILGTAGQVLPGKLGSIASSAGAVASAFASGGPLLGGIALAGVAFKGLSSLFGGGKSQMEKFIESVRRARQTLSTQFELLDIEDATRQFALTLAQAQSVFKGTSFESFFEGLTLENIQARIDAIILGGPNTGRVDLGTDSEIGKAFIDFIMRLEGIGDAAESALGGLADAASEATAALRNVPSGFKIALARFRASDPEPGRQVSTGTGGSYGGGFTPMFGSSPAAAGTVWNVDTIVLQGVKDPADFLTQLEAQVQWRKRTGAAVLQTSTR